MAAADYHFITRWRVEATPEEVFRIILQLKSQQVTMLLVEQFAAAALEVSDYAYVLESGRIAVEGPAAQLKGDPAVRAAYLGDEAA